MSGSGIFNKNGERRPFGPQDIIFVEASVEHRFEDCTTWASAKRSALLMVPSVMAPEESNVLINPRHADAVRITSSKQRRWLYDARIGVGV